MASTIKLGDAATFVNGYPFKPETWTETGLPIIRIQNLNNPEAPFNHYSGPIPEKYVVRQGDILISWSASLGAYEWKGEDAYLNQHIFKVVFDKCVIDKHFLRYAVESKLAEMEKGAHGATMRHIVKKDFDNTLIPYPPIAEQEKIVAELDLLSGIIEKQNAQLKELDTLAQSIFYDMFGDPLENGKGWEVQLLKDSVQEMFLGPFGSALKTDSYVEEEDSFCMVYEQKHAIRKTMNVETHFINEEKYKSLKRFEVHAGDFIMSCRGTIGEIYRLPTTAPIGIIHPSLMKIRIKEDVYSPIFFQWLLARVIKNENTNGNCVQMAITAKELGQRTPIVPPLSLQQSFAEKIEAIEQQKARINTSIAETQKLFDYTMDKYFG